MSPSDNVTDLPVHTPTYPPTISTRKPFFEVMGADRANGSPEGRKAKGIARLTVHIPSAFRNPTENSTSTQAHTKSLWSTPEFKLYYLVALFAIPMMAWIPIALSQNTHPNYVFYVRRLSQGWINGRLVDNSDAQYRSFRNNIPILTKAMIGYLPLKYIARRFLKTSSEHTLYLMPFNMILSIIVLIALHGTSALKIGLILTLNFIIAKTCRESFLGPVLTWTFNIFVMFMNEIYSGYSFGAISPALAGLDAFRGAYPSWHVSFNITMLRLISFNMDYYWSCKNTDSSDVDANQPSEKQRVTVPHPDALYSAVNYIAYILYPPLYIAGPIITFNDFMWQHRRNTVISTRFKIMYILRFLACLLTMEFILHYMYMVAIKDSKAWAGDTPAQIAMIGFWNLIIVWLKLLIPWRFFRAWALLDGIDPPENMVRCMVNNYSAFGFWRSWHRSYNLWIIRYIYIPLGGSKNVAINTLIIFSFVALWHDLTLRLLAWGWLISLFVLPELAATYLLPKSKYGKFAWYRHACAVGGVFNIIMMVAANLVGFVIGTDGVAFFFGQLFGTWDGIKFMVICASCMFVGVQLMFEYREEELRQGIVRRC